MEERKIDGGKDHEVETDYVEEDLDQQGKQTAQPELEEKLTKQEEEVIDEARNAKKLKDEEALKKRAIETYKIEMLREELKNKTKKEEADKVFKEKVRLEFDAAGYDEESIEKLLTMEEKNKDYGQKKTIDLTRPAYIKLHRKHLSPDTLDTYELPWEWDDVSSFLEILCKALKTDLGLAKFELYYCQTLDPGTRSRNLVRAYTEDARGKTVTRGKTHTNHRRTRGT